MSVEIDVIYNGNLSCTATHGPSGRTIITDAPVDNGGRGESFSPTDLVATALGTCIMTILGLYAKRSDLDLTGTRIHVIKEMTAEPARRVGELRVSITYPAGLDLSDKDRTKLERIVHTCPVHQSLHPDIRIDAEFIYPDK